MMHRSFPRGYKVGRSVNAALLNKGAGGLLGKSPKMPMPSAQIKRGVGGPLARRPVPTAPRRGVGADCGCDAEYVAAGVHMPTCGMAATGVPQSLFTTIDDEVAAGGTAQLTAQVTGGVKFCPTSFLLPDDIAADWRVDSIMYNGQNLVMNGQAVRGDFFSSKNEFGGRIQGCCVPAALSLTVNLTNISGTTASYVQGEFKGSYPS